MKTAKILLGALLTTALAMTAHANGPAKELSDLVEQLPTSGAASIAYDIQPQTYTVSFPNTQTISYVVGEEIIGEFVSSKPAPSICIYTNKKGTLKEESCLSTPRPIYANLKSFTAPNGTPGCVAQTDNGYALVLVGKDKPNMNVLTFTNEGTKIIVGN